MSQFDTRSSAQIVFLGYEFRQSTKYLFLALLEEEDFRDRVVWLTPKSESAAELRREGFPAFQWTADPGHQHTWMSLARAKLVVADGVLFDWPAFQLLLELISDKPLLQVWHGLPTKDLGYDLSSRSGDLEHFLGWHRLVRRVTYVNCPSSAPQALAAYSADWPNSEILRLAEARRWGLCEQAPTGAHLNAAGLPDWVDTSAPVTLWAPTSREAGMLWNSNIAKMVRDACEVSGQQLIVRPHPADATLWQACWDAGLTRQQFVAADTDIYPLLPSIDVVITDYSGLAYDFPFLSAKGIRLHPNEEEYGSHRTVRWLETMTQPPVQSLERLVECLTESGHSSPKPVLIDAEKAEWLTWFREALQ